MEDYEVIEIQGFDTDGEPEIRVFEDGHLELVFNFMPPLNGSDEPREDDDFWDNFETALQTHLGVEVQRDDREWFLIPQPKKSTIAKLKLYLESFWE